MLYHFLYQLKEFWFGFNVFKYITFRAGLAAFTSFVICVSIGPVIIKWLRAFKIGQYVRREHVEEIYNLHKHKEGTPTMGGILIIVSVVVSSLLWCRLDNSYVLLTMAGMIWLGLVGFLDDFMKLKNKSSKGIRGVSKLAGQIIIALIVGIFVLQNEAIGADLYLPFIKNSVCNLGILYIIFILIVIVGSSNAVNLTDGLDGLAVGCVIFVTFTYAVFSYITGHVNLSEYLHIFYLPGAGELAVFCAALMGAGLGFLWFNSYPATIFMGDTGALSLGGTIAIISVLIKKEFLLLLAGAVLVFEALSVIIQVTYFKTTKKRVFLMTPIHHHFQIKGWHEAKITTRFLIVAAIFAILSIAALKVR